MHSKRVVSSRVRSLPWICTYSVWQIEIILNQRCDYNRTTAAKETIIMFHTSTSTCSQLVELNQFIRLSIHSEHCYYSIMTDTSVCGRDINTIPADEEDNILTSSGGWMGVILPMTVLRIYDNNAVNCADWHYRILWWTGAHKEWLKRIGMNICI